MRKHTIKKSAKISTTPAAKRLAKAPTAHTSTPRRARITAPPASHPVDQRPRDPRAGRGGWREETLARVRTLILSADPEIIEERKWAKPSNPTGVPVWSRPNANGSGMICTGETYKAAVKLTFARGAELPDPSRLFNSSLEGKTRRAIDIREGEKIDAKWAAAFTALVRAAVALHETPTNAKTVVKPKPGSSNARPSKPPRNTLPKNENGVVLLSGGNPQIAKGSGDAPVQAYIAAMSGGGPGWKRDVGRRLDELITRTVPGVRKAVKWNSPFYGAADPTGDAGWFLGVHVFAKYVKVAFFRGASLRPPPPGTSKQKHVRYLDIRENDWGTKFDDAQLTDWVTQASRLPGERM